MKPNLSLVVNTKNAAGTLERCLHSAKEVVDEIVVMDMHSTDATTDVAAMFDARVFFHDDVGYVEPARNAAIAAASGDWILILDADEILSEQLRDQLIKLISDPEADAYFLPRQNIIFGKFMHTGWWPDYQLRLFRRDAVTWLPQIHSVPKVSGKAIYLPPDEKVAIIHYNYNGIDEYWDRAQRYAAIVAAQNATAADKDLDPLGAFFTELLNRYYAQSGCQDGRHGEFLSILQGCTSVMEVAQSWEHRGFADKNEPPKLSAILQKYARDARWWEAKREYEQSSGLRRWLAKIKQIFNQ